MARPLSTSDNYRGGSYQPRYTLDDPPATEQREMDLLRSENEQLRALCTELEQALHEATQNPMGAAGGNAAADERLRDYEALLEEKSETIRQLHQQLQEATAALAEADARGVNSPSNRRQGPAPREDDLLQLSEDLERERRQIQEDEQALMEQMRQMEMGMARERAEIARQRNDLQRLYGEIRHELERLERSGVVQTKMDDLKAKLQDVSNRRGAAPSGLTPGSKPASSAALPNVRPGQTPPGGTPAANTDNNAGGKSGFIGRFFGGGGNK